MSRLKKLRPFLVVALLGACKEKTYGNYCHSGAVAMTLAGDVLVSEYENEDLSVDWHLTLTWLFVVSVRGWDVTAVEVQDGSDNSPLATVFWATRMDFSDGGIRILSYADHPNGEEYLFDPPLEIASACVRGGDTLRTSTSGADWTSTYSNAGCSTSYDPRWSDAECYHMVVADGDSIPSTHGWISGEYWMLPTLGPVKLRLDALPGTWSLLDVQRAD